MARIYISSTFKDLENERAAASNAIRKLEHHPRCMEDYVAVEETWDEYCADDVRSCQAYVGIVAWRYGYVHPGRDKSVTHLEYEAARASGIPCLIFLLADDAPWPAEWRDPNPRIAAFREQLRRETGWAPFTTQDDLAVKVIAAVAHRLGVGRPVSSDLPYLCDRSSQEFDLREALVRSPQDRPLFAIVHGDELQCHDKFLERLRGVMLPKLLELDQDAKVNPYRLSWPPECKSKAQLASRLRLRLGEAVCQRANATVEEIQRRLAQDRGPALIDVTLFSSDFRELGAGLLETVAELLAAWPALEVEQQLLFVLSVQYQLKTGQKPKERRKAEEANRLLAETLERFSFPPGMRGTTLTRLESIEQAEVVRWAQAAVPSALCGGELLFPGIRRVFARWESQGYGERIPMESLAASLLELLYDHNSPKELT